MRTLSISLSPEEIERAEGIARRENRTVSELIGDALREYEQNHWWRMMNEYGGARAADLGMTEADVIPAIQAVRRTRAQQRHGSE